MAKKEKQPKKPKVKKVKRKKQGKDGDDDGSNGMDNPLARTDSRTSSNGAKSPMNRESDFDSLFSPQADEGGEGNIYKENADLAAQLEIERLRLQEVQVKYDLAQTKIKGYKERDGMGASQKVEKLEDQLDRQERELDTLRRTLFIESKQHPSAKVRKISAKVRNNIAAEDPVHESPNTIRKVQDLAAQSMKEHGDGEDIIFVWAFMFKMPPQDTDVTLEIDEEQEEEELYDSNGKPRRDDKADRSLKISHEAWVCCEKIVACDLCFEYVIPIDARHLIVAVGASHEIMMDEAHAMGLLMRMQETKGSIEFHPDLIRFFNANHGGLNEWNDGKWNRRDIDGFENHWKPDDQLNDLELAKRQIDVKKIFSSGLQQRIVMSRLKRMGRYFPDRMIQLGSQSKPRDKILKQVTDRAITKRKNLAASMIDDMLLLFGGFRPQNQMVFPRAGDRPVIATLSKLVVADDQFLLTPTGLQTLKPSETMILSYEDISDAVNILERWMQGAGREEVFSGTLEGYFPLHVDKELAYLKREWATPKIIIRGVIVGYDPESEPKLYEEGPPKKYQMNTFGSCGNSLHEHSFPWSLTYQPLDEVRDYFGDDLGLYFSWIGLYTAMLVVCSLFGVVVQIVQPIYGGVEKNPLTTVYSIYVGLWSISFLETWNRRENELRFLWGTAQLSKIEEPRKEFIGVLETNAETGRQVMEHKSRGMYNFKILMSMMLSLFFIVFTICSAIAAQMVRYISPINDGGILCEDIDAALDDTLTMDDLLNGDFAGDPWTATGIFASDGSGNGTDVDSWTLQKCFGDRCYTNRELTELDPCSLFQKQKFQLGSACLNLAIIGIYGFIFEALAYSLCEWENHRTDSEFENSRVSKNFLFQFINNYFVLFYIAYLREIEDPITGSAHPCAGGNCLPELQTQLIVVFTAKTIGKQIAFTIKPFVFKWKAAIMANSVTKNIVKQAAKGKALMPRAMLEAMEEVVSVAGGRDDPVQQLENLKKIRNPYELQSRLQPYPGSFDDFNDRVIQFGYLVLFAPAFPLAPFFAFLNNVVEIRTGSFRVAVAYRRPVWKQRAGIGSWLGVLNVLGFLAVITNASMITFVGSQDAENRGLITTGFFDRTRQWQLWLQFAITEHCVLMMRVVILSLSPSFPRWITQATEILEYRVETRYLTQEYLDAAKRVQDEYARKMHDGKHQIAKALYSTTQEEIEEMFEEIDQDHSGTLDERELGKLFQKMDVHLLPAEVHLCMSEIDNGGDMSISCKEMIEWMTETGLWMDPVDREAGVATPRGYMSNPTTPNTANGAPPVNVFTQPDSPGSANEV